MRRGSSPAVATGLPLKNLRPSPSSASPTSPGSPPPKHVSPSHCESGLPPWSSSESRNGSEAVKGLKSLSELRKMLDHRRDEQMSGDRLCCPIRLLQLVTRSLNLIQSKPNFSAFTAEKVQMCELFALSRLKGQDSTDEPSRCYLWPHLLLTRWGRFSFEKEPNVINI